MTIADEARANSISCEMVKYAYRQTKDGVVVSFVVHPNDIPAALSISHIGARYMVALVQIGDDEKPIPLKTAKEPKTIKTAPELQPDQTDKPRPAGGKREPRSFRDKSASQQAFLIGRNPVFWAFLNEAKGYKVASEDDAKEAVYELCGVSSRTLLDLPENHRQRTMWNLLLSAFQAWELVGA